MMRRGSILVGMAAGMASFALSKRRAGTAPSLPGKAPTGVIRLFLCGDVMTGRAIDQIMPRPNSPEIYERHIKDAREYLSLGEKVSGPIPRGVTPAYIWGDALEVLAHTEPDARIINLETSITTASEPWPGKLAYYRMNPANVACLSVAKPDCCVLANNHVLDWGIAGLTETLSSLHAAGIQTAGAGATALQAGEPAAIECGQDRRVLVFAYGCASSGVRDGWAATSETTGIQVIDEANPAAIDRISWDIGHFKRRGDIAVVSIHWGGNWGYDVPGEQRHLAHQLIDRSGADVIYGHSSHHPKPFEVYKGKLILYGCGDFINDYEGIAGYTAYRPELVAMYLPEIDAESGRLLRLVLVPMRVQKFRVERASALEGEWLRNTLNWHSRAFGTRLKRLGRAALEVVSP